LSRWLLRRPAACTTNRAVRRAIGHRKAINGVSLLTFSAFQVASSFDFVDCIVESGNFFFLQRAIATLGHISQFQWANRHATKHNHFVSEPREYTTYFTVLSFTQRDIDFGATLSNFANGRSINACHTFGQINTPLKASHGIVIHLTCDHDKVSLRYTVFRVSQSLG
jgi:hypothetical protein